MTMRLRLSLSAILALICIASPAVAGEFWYGYGRNVCGSLLDDACYRHAQHVIHRKEDLIAYLEADPDVDDGFKAPVIVRARAKIHRLRAAVGIRHIIWPTPCCYSRKPIYIR